MRSHRAAQRAFTTVELLTVIAIIAILMALLLPAVAYMREMARQTQCLNNLKNIGLAFQQHANAYKVYPNAGGHDLHAPEFELGRCDSSTATANSGPLVIEPAKRQDWGWAYQILPYVDKKATYDSSASAYCDATRHTEWQVPLYFCPTRRKVDAPNGVGCGLPEGTPRPGIDYAGNGGYRNKEFANGKWQFVMNNGMPKLYPYPSPNSQQHADGMVIPGKRPLAGPGALMSANPNNLSHTDAVQGEYIQFGDSSMDGASTTILVGERRFVPLRDRRDSDDPHPVLAEDNGFVAGYTWDTIRWAYLEPAADGPLNEPGLLTAFGSSHGTICQFVYCDGSTKKINYGIDLATFRALCSRNDSNFGMKEAP